MSQVPVYHDKDPKQKILDDLGEVTSRIEIAGSNAVVAMYIRPNKMIIGGKVLELSDKTTGDDRYQSKVGLLVAAGPDAFKDPSGKWFNGVEFKIGDWILVPPSCVNTVVLRGTICKIVQDTSVCIKLNDPDDAY